MLPCPGDQRGGYLKVCVLQSLRPAFSREAAFEWLVIMVWGILCNRASTITSYLNAVGLSEYYCGHALHWFHAKSGSAKTLSFRWHQGLSSHKNVKGLKGQPVYVRDGIKVPKEERKIPLIKKLSQESDKVTKPEWMRVDYLETLVFYCNPAILYSLSRSLFIFKIKKSKESL